MNPFYDENFYYNNFNPQMNPMNQGFPVNRKLKTRANLQKHYIMPLKLFIPLIK